MTEAPEFTRPRKIVTSDEVDGFSCGQADLDGWLHKFAVPNQLSGMARVFVSMNSQTVAGYYALSTGGVEHEDAPGRIKKGIPRHPIPVVILTRLATDLRFQGFGLGRMLVRDALIRIDRASEEVGVRSLLIHAKDLAARDFYMKIAEFEPSPTDELHLHLLMKDLRKALVS
ncbi:GNAT family N-acetyltransferase [Cryobacterium glucosi]|uniref:GNAT family N-acetyltransferase n=1 Tax=Cryobacterium glucosi TaxID=1259175 RepID=A0ABY2INP2_9MICO|nr:GNAT family N-acetyltransferase [Cryobacterium glucosi]